MRRSLLQGGSLRASPLTHYKLWSGIVLGVGQSSGVSPIVDTWIVPSGVYNLHARLRAGGSGGGGGGSATTLSGVSAQTGGSGGTAGDVRDVAIAVMPGWILNIRLGTGGSGGTGGAANGNAGGLSGSANDTVIEIIGGRFIDAAGGGYVIYTVGAIACSGSAANSTAVVQTTPYGAGAAMPTTELTPPGSGGASAAATGAPFIGPVGGTGGGTATASLGGAGGIAMQLGQPESFIQHPVGNSASANGVNGQAASVDGCGGGGGGGGAPGGTGGNGGAGGPGRCEFWY